MSKEHKKRLEAFRARTDTNPGEQHFATSLALFVDRVGRMTDPQWSAFERMEARYSEENIRIRKNWELMWDEEKAAELEVAKIYYSNNGYFQRLVQKITEQKGYIPTEGEYNKLIRNNKYVQKVLAQTRTAPLFAAGSLVKVRKSRQLPRQLSSLADRIAVVIDNTGPIISATKGSRPYVILPFGTDTPVSIEERWLKQKRK